MTKQRNQALATSLAAIALLAAACAPQTSQWSNVEAPKENRVDLLRFSHPVQFRAGDDRVSPAEAERLSTFLTTQNVGYGDQIALVGNESAVSRRREDALVRTFARQGVRVIRGAQVEGLKVPDNEVRVVVARHVLTPPVCPNWGKRADDDFGNTINSNHGCATTTNLGLMVADPHDLVAGRPTSPADGEISAFRVESYRHGTYPNLLRGDAQPNADRKDIVKGAK